MLTFISHRSSRLLLPVRSISSLLPSYHPSAIIIFCYILEKYILAQLSLKRGISYSVKIMKTAFVIFCLVILFENSIGPLSTPSSSLGYSRSLSMLSLPERPKPHPHAFLKLTPTPSQIAPFKAWQHSLPLKNST
jgi:hypothetical protein